MGMSTGNNKGFMAEINVTPFVDVMLVLLIIFMVTAPMMTQGLEVDLPQTRTVTALPEDPENLIVTIRRDGALFLNEYPTDMENLQAQIERIAVEKKQLIFLRADRDVPYGVVIQVMGIVKAAGVDKLGVVAEPERPETTKK
ncbi:protein TolR [Desulfovibrio inopinatus]|uniref:protein TolR n=1 Tax=Desulfovibrio inopinatus TaxID=102109 RepID=UPI0004205414|nr:protein TolR [Desulfovibrio inopinatus]